jgi:hypothetical protein
MPENTFEPPLPPGGVPRAERIMPFMRMYWYLERWETCVYVAMGRGRWRARAAMMLSFSSSESTAPEGSRSSGRGALASRAAPLNGVSFERKVCVKLGVLTLELRLVLLLVLREKHVVGQTSAGDSSLEAHGVTLACQAPGAEAAVWQRYATLPFDVDGPLGLRALGLGFVLFLLLCVWALFCPVIELALLALLCALAVHDGALHSRLARAFAGLVVLSLLFPESGIFGFLGFLLLLELLLLLVQALSDV